jgi:AraC-like DNA-binding protein
MSSYLQKDLLSSSVDAISIGEGVPGRLPDVTLARVIEFIDAHLFDAVSLNDLAEAAFLSRFHFSRRFLVSTGQSPMSYLQRRRIERAKMLLRAGDHSVSEIATRLAFADHSHFAKVFRRLAGCSPSAFAQHDDGDTYHVYRGTKLSA